MSDVAVRAAAVTLVVLLVTGGTATAFSTPQQVDVDADSTQLSVDLRPDGAAEWEIVYRIRLDDETAIEAFETLRQDVQNDSTPYTERMRDRMERTASTAENATDRQMAIRNVTVETQTQPSYGLLVYRFEWTNFAAVEGETIRAGDAIEQFYLDSTTSLRMAWPDGYAPQSVEPSATRTGESEVVWEGELSFSPGEPRVVAAPAGATPTETTGPATGGPDGSPGGSLPLFAAAILGVLVVGAAVWLYARRNGAPTPIDGGDNEDGDGAAATASGGDGDEGPPPELLSNEERVLRLLEQNGGRMKQKEVAEQLDWTAAKTSQVVGDLRDADELDSFRLGRENVLTLPDVELEPDADESDD